MSEKSKSLLASEINRHHDNANVTTNVPWPEWRDLDLNNEKWGIPKDGLFLDTEHIVMPRSFEPHEWIRAKDLKRLTGPLVMYTSTVEYPDLITNNRHLLHSEFVRWFVSALTNLQYCGREGLEIGGEGSNFMWTGRHEPWYGWMHVYSLNKAGKGAQHRPAINPNGKYIVRLHCVGCWRRIVVDDTIPVNQDGIPLLPRTSDNFELWPMLLAKALLKVASLTWTERREIVDFHPIACLTGWMCLTLNIAHLSIQDKWSFLMKYPEHFQWTPQTAHGYASVESANDDTTDKTRRSKEIAKSLAEKPQPTALFLLLRDMRELESDVVPGLSPCWDHVIYVIQSRDVPLDPKDIKPPLERWKSHRWLKWAISQGIIDPADYFVPIRYLRTVSSLAERNENFARICDEVDVANGSIYPDKMRHYDKSASRKMMDSLFAATREGATGDISRWIDFNKMAPYITEVQLLYKLEYFPYSAQITSDTMRTINEDRKATDVKETRKAEKKDTYNSSGNVKTFNNMPLYLLCDSPREKFLLISLCAAPMKKDTDSCRRDYLILEKYNFFRQDQSDQLAAVSTAGTKSTVVELAAGRLLLRVYCRLNSGLAIISSDTDFRLGSRATVQQTMTAESCRTEQMSQLISESLRKAYRSFGTDDYPVMLKNYYRSYMPAPDDLAIEDKSLRALIHRFFMEEQVRLVAEVFPDVELGNVLRSLRVFFLNPNIRPEYFHLTRVQKNLKDLATEGTPETRPLIPSDHEDVLNRAATTTQSFFKMALVRRYKDLHKPNHTLHTRVREELERISTLFDPSLISHLLRNVINRHSSLRDSYLCSDDFVHVLNIRTFRGTLDNIKYNQWCPIARFVMNPKPSRTALATFELLTDLPRVALRVFNNENRREMTRDLNQVAPGRYEYLPAGYTVFAYGWSDKQRFKEIDWTIRAVTMKGEEIFYQPSEQWPPSWEIKLPNLTVEELTATYTPNARSCVARWNLLAISGSVISIRLAASYSMAEIGVRITDEGGNVLASANGGSVILLPLIILERRAKDEKDYSRTSKDGSSDFEEESKVTMEGKDLYRVEALVLNNSWPLTDAEWTIVNQMKIKSAGNIETRMPNKNEVPLDLTKKSSKQLIDDSQSSELPHCVLQVVMDSGTAVQISQDKTREQRVALLKESWWSKDGDRPERGRELREAFLNATISQIDSEEFAEQDGEPPSVMEDEDVALCLPRAPQRRTPKPPASHRLPALDLTRYTKRDERTETRRGILKSKNTVNVVHNRRDHSDCPNNLAELPDKQFWRYAKLFRKKEESFGKRRALVDAAYELRKAHVDASLSERAKIRGKRD